MKRFRQRLFNALTASCALAFAATIAASIWAWNDLDGIYQCSNYPDQLAVTERSVAIRRYQIVLARLKYKTDNVKKYRERAEGEPATPGFIRSATILGSPRDSSARHLLRFAGIDIWTEPFDFSDTIQMQGQPKAYLDHSTELINCVTLPYWLILAVLAPVPIARLAIIWKDRQSQKLRKQGRCQTCGYDLRATPERCPECGAVPAKREIVPS